MVGFAPKGKNPMTNDNRIQWAIARLDEEKVKLTPEISARELDKIEGRIEAWTILLDSLNFEKNGSRFS